MRPSRRRLLALTGAAAVLPAAARMAAAQPYPTRPVRLMVGFPAGGPNDILARLIAQWLTDRLGRPFVVENRPGASGNIATEAVVRAPADGYTLLLVGPANAIGASLYANLSFNFLRDIAPVAGITREPLVMVVHPSVPARTVAQFIADAKAHAGPIKMASTGSGSSPHVSGELVTTTTRAAALPHVPALADVVPGYEASAVTGIGAPKETSAEIIATLNTAINAAFADPTMKARLADTGGTMLAGSPAEFGRLLVQETEKWAEVVKSSGAKPD